MKNVLSLFNGISGCHLALDKAGIECGQVYYAEIDKFANKVTEFHYQNDINLGDVTNWREWDIDWSQIDLVTGGFPCQSWSLAGKQLGDKDEQGMLFWVTLDIIKNVLTHNPSAKWLMENVKMKKDFENYITDQTEQALGYVEKTMINSSLLSAQNRQRIYWTNFKITQPEDKGVLLRDVLDDADFNKRPCERIKEGNTGHIANATDIKGMDCIKRVYGQDGKAPTLTTMGGGHREPKVSTSEITYRKLTPTECARLQTFPDGWCESIVSKSQSYKAYGNSWTVDVITHIFKDMLNDTTTA